MANSEIVGLIDSYILYADESTYGSAVTPDTVFGGLIQSSSFEVARNNTEHAGMVGSGASDGRVTAKFTPGTVSTRASVNFLAQRFDWMEYLLMGTKTGSGTVASPYVYSIGRTWKSLTVTEEIDNVTTDSERIYAGMVVNSATIRCSVGQPVSVDLELVGGKIAKDTGVVARIAQLSDDLYNFSGGTIEMPDATSIGNVIDSVEFTYSNNVTVLYGFSQEAVNARPGKINIGLRFSLKYLDDDQMDKLMGSSTAVSSQTPVTLALKFTRGNQYVDFVFSGVVIDRITDSHNLNEFMVEDNDLLAKSLVVTEAQTDS